MEPKVTEGIFSTKKSGYIGHGATKRKAVQKRYWIAGRISDERMAVRPLDHLFGVMGSLRIMSMDEFRDGYEYEPEVTASPQAAAARRVWAEELQQKIKETQAEAKGAPQAGLLIDDDPFDVDEAELPLEEAVNRIREYYDLGLEYLGSGKIVEAVSIFETMAASKAKFKKAHKHLFNQFAMDLRKRELPAVALKHYFRALELSPEDENLHYNIARALYEADDLRLALKYLNQSLRISPGLKASKRLKAHILEQMKENSTG